MCKRFTAALMALFMVICLLPVSANAEEYTGTCGDTLTWTLTEDGVLTISGYGQMYDYGLYGNGQSSPWFAYRKDIKELVISDSVTNIGNEAFYGCTGLTAVNLPEGITKIGRDAFADCTGLTTVNLPNSLMEIGSYAFGWCSKLTAVIIPAGVSTISEFAFGRCSSLTEITFLGDAPAIGQDVFSRVVANVYYPGENETWTAEKMINYGGTLTWIAAGGAAEVLLGDVNGDGAVDTTDAKLVMQYDLGLIGADGLDLSVADVNADDAIDTTDAKLIMQLDLGLITEFPKP